MKKIRRMLLVTGLLAAALWGVETTVPNSVESVFYAWTYDCNTNCDTLYSQCMAACGNTPYCLTNCSKLRHDCQMQICKQLP